MNKINLLKLLFTTFAIVILGSLYAQRGGQGQGGERIKPILKGKIMDDISNEPLEYATITLFAQKDSSMVTGSITDEKGVFKIETRPGRFFAKIEFLAFQTQTIENIQLGKANPVMDLGTLSLLSDSETLMEVEVRAERSQMQMSLDKRVFNVGKDLSSTGGSAEDILNNVPSVNVDIDGAVSLRGSENVRILIDGKPSGLVGVDNANGLRSLPSNLIDQVEVITNPSAKYEAEGMTGIINIVLRKEKKKGVNGSIDVSGGYPENYGVGINMNMRRNKFNFFTNYGLSYRDNPGQGKVFRQIFTDRGTEISEQIRTSTRAGLSNSIRFGTDYYFNDQNTLTGSFLYRISDEDNFSEYVYNDFLDFFRPENFVSRSNRTDVEKEKETALQYSLNYKKKFDRKGQVFTIDIQYEDDLETETSDFTESFFNADLSPGIPDLLQRSSNSEGEKQWLFQMDYTQPISEEGKLEFGLRSTIRDINNDYLVEEFEDNIWRSIEDLSNEFLYNENIHAAYAIFGDKKGKFSYQLGLRGELSDVKTELIQTNEINDRNYFDLFPSAHFTYDLANNNSVQISYSRRIRRPRFWDLNPFFSFSDSRSFFSGNPNVDPEYTNSMELGHVKYWDKGSLSSSIYYRHTEGVIQRITELGLVDGDTLFVTKPQNLSTENAYGFEFTFSYNPQKWLRLSGDVNLFRAITDGTNFGNSFESDTYTLSSRISSMFTLWKELEAQVRFVYRAPRETTQGRRKALYTVDLGLSKDIWKKKATLTLSVRDAFNSRKRRFETIGPGFFREGEFQWRSRVSTLKLNYRINQKKRRGRGRGGYQGGGGGEF